jgi:hypothetical protein
MEEELTMNGQHTNTQPRQENREQQPSTAPIPHQPQDKAGLTTEEYLKEISELDLPDHITDWFKIYLQKDFIYSKLTKDDIHEIKWLARTRAIEIIARHPSQDCIYPPEYQSDIYNISINDCYEPLTREQQSWIIDLAEDIYVRAARSEGGWQQDEHGKTMNVNRNEDPEPRDNGGRLDKLWGVFG